MFSNALRYLVIAAASVARRVPVSPRGVLKVMLRPQTVRKPGCYTATMSASRRLRLVAARGLSRPIDPG
jgi:hypothetical protein